MNSTYIWVFDLADKYLKNELIIIEIYVARNKFTKKGLFSGPLRKKEINNLDTNDDVKFFLNLKGIRQIGKNKFLLSKYAMASICEYFSKKNMLAAYCRLNDKGLHIIKSFTKSKKIIPVYYNNNNFTLFYTVPDKNENLYHIENNSFKAKLFLKSEKKYVRGYLIFSYNNIDIDANSSIEYIIVENNKVFRNMQFENDIKSFLYNIGGIKSYRNEILFLKNRFFYNILNKLINTNIELYWGEKNKKISKAKFNCNISYDMDWFTVSGTVEDQLGSYDLAKLILDSRGHSFVELNDNILFIPKELQKNNFEIDNKKLQIRKNNLNKVNEIASYFHIDSDIYLKKLFDFSNVKCTLPKAIESILKPYQKIGVNWILSLYKNGFGGCLADDMGLGKTLQTIAFLSCKERISKLPILIIVPKIILLNWEKEINKFMPDKKIIIAYGSYDFHNLNELNTIYISTYDTVVMKKEEFQKSNFDCIIIDEAQYIKNYRTQRYAAIKNLKSNFRLALTGTPIENNIEELFSLFDILNPDLLKNYRRYIKNFTKNEISKDVINNFNKVISPFILRREKENVLKELPFKNEKYVYCEMEEDQRRLYNNLFTSVKKEIESKPNRFVIKDNSVILEGLLYLREACVDPQLLPPVIRGKIPCGSCKFELFKEYAENIMKESRKLIIYSQFPKVFNKMMTWASKKGWNIFYIDGKTKDRQTIIDNFEMSDEGIFFISLKAGGVGLNLVSCQYVIIFEPWWNIAAERQASDRVYRIGQKKPVFIYHFLIKNSIEDKMFELQNKKKKLIQNVLVDLEYKKKINLQELCNLLFKN